MENIIASDKTPLGANYNEETKCVEFRLYSKNATKVQLCIFDKPQGADPIMVLNMERCKNNHNIFHTEVKDYILNCNKTPILYGFRVFGANWEYKQNFEPGSKIGFISKVDSKNNRFNPNKIAYDPYSKELSHTVSQANSNNNLFHSGGDFYLIDNAKWAIKSVFFPQKERKIAKVKKRPFNTEIIGEVHIKDLTQNINIKEKGTYRGAQEFAQNLKDLGITMVEFLPLNEFDSRQNGINHWGYMPLGYFSLARKYANNKNPGSLLDEFRSMVDEFHKNDLKVCLDMVYNHTGEAGLINNNREDANLLSYALIDNSSYYKVFDNGYYRSNSGCGNDFNASDSGVMDLIIDSLIFWINQGVDAFRFDLAAALLENSCNCKEIYDNIDSLAAKLKERLKEKGINVVDDFNRAQDGVVLIAEPWTCGGSQCYQLGNFPSFWAEWNDVFRDTVRKLTIRPAEIAPVNIKDVFEGTPSRFKGFDKSINFVACHDGYTLRDLNSYNPTNNQIASNHNLDPKKRENSIRKQLAFLFLSYGIPMIQIGDIIMHTKNGDSNSYNKDDNTNHLNWKAAFEKGSFENRILEYTKSLIEFRKQNPIFSSREFLKNVTYHYDNGQIADFNNKGYWFNNNDAFFGALVNAQNRIYIASNKSNARINTTLPETKEGLNWFKRFDTSDFSDIHLGKRVKIERNYILNEQSLVIFTEEKI